MSELNASNLRKEQGNEGPDLVGTTELTSPYFMVPPSGSTDERPQNPQPGTLRFNTDSGSLEYFRKTDNDEHWETISRTTIDYDGGVRIINGGGVAPGPSYVNTMDYFADAAPANSVDFGDLGTNRNTNVAACGSRTRGIWAGDAGGYENVIEYATISSTGNAVNFGDKILKTMQGSMLSTQTRGVFAGGYVPGGPSNVLEYITIAATGNAVDFGDMSVGHYAASAASSSTRGIIAGTDTSPVSNVIDYITMASTGNGTDFGDVPVTRIGSSQGGANATRMIVPIIKDSGGSTTNHIDYLTIATLGNSIDFGDLTVARGGMGGAASRLHFFACGGPGSDVVDKCTILTTGNFIDFGNLSQTRYGCGGTSNGHGGL